jgi:hypothetical protein
VGSNQAAASSWSVSRINPLYAICHDLLDNAYFPYDAELNSERVITESARIDPNQFLEGPKMRAFVSSGRDVNAVVPSDYGRS